MKMNNMAQNVKHDVGQYLKIESLQGGEIIGDVGMC
jgi:hypothetical protein